MIDLTRLSMQGRAYSVSRAWEPAELDALLTLERERGIARIIAADYIRNGITTVEAYDKAVAASFVPATTADAMARAEAMLKENKFATEVAKAPEVEPVKKSGKKK